MDKWEYVEFGDLEAALIQMLTDAPEISGFSEGAPTVTTTLDGFNAGDLRIIISLEGGNHKKPVIQRARVDFNVFGPRRTVAHDLAQKALAVVFRESGQPFPDFNLRIISTRVETGLVRIDDKFSDSPRFLFSLRIAHVPYSYSS